MSALATPMIMVRSAKPLMRLPELAPPGGLPVDVRQGAYGLAIALTAIGAILASILPARSAARVDPVEVIGQ
jgi:lipoprotein-releasing system permease protein